MPPRTSRWLGGSLNQSDWKTQFAAQSFFPPRHLSVVVFVIVTAQVQDAVQNQNLDFFGSGVPE